MCVLGGGGGVHAPPCLGKILLFFLLSILNKCVGGRGKKYSCMQPFSFFQIHGSAPGNLKAMTHQPTQLLSRVGS